MSESARVLILCSPFFEQSPAFWGFLFRCVSTDLRWEKHPGPVSGEPRLRFSRRSLAMWEYADLEGVIGKIKLQ